MKKLTIEQMEITQGGKMLACLGQGFSGVEVLGSIALLMTVSNPIGWGLLAIGVLGLTLTVAADPGACN